MGGPSSKAGTPTRHADAEPPRTEADPAGITLPGEVSLSIHHPKRPKRTGHVGTLHGVDAAMVDRMTIVTVGNTATRSSWIERRPRTADDGLPQTATAPCTRHRRTVCGPRGVPDHATDDRRVMPSPGDTTRARRCNRFRCVDTSPPSPASRTPATDVARPGPRAPASLVRSRPAPGGAVALPTTAPPEPRACRTRSWRGRPCHALPPAVRPSPQGGRVTSPLPIPRTHESPDSSHVHAH